ATREISLVDTYEQFQEAMLMGLRLREGVSLQKLQDFGAYLDMSRVNNLISEGYLEDHSDRLQVTSEGLQRLNGLLDYLLN
ncbi:MAG: coproporphyrinogen III oxidase, partial [Alphaproteobacteria bacterium]|nr:coproporphyrinogen III oxidase [Alphaproteobacteria bacterium]